MYTAIWAEDQNGVIGEKGTLPWHLPNDLKSFKEKTVNKTIIMGRKTFEGMGSRLLPNRKTVILTSNPNYQVAGAEVMHSVAEVQTAYGDSKEEIMIIGGKEIFEVFLPYTDKIYRTLIQESFTGDTYAPSVKWEEWEKFDVVEGIIDEKNIYPHDFETYRRMK